VADSVNQQKMGRKIYCWVEEEAYDGAVDVSGISFVNNGNTALAVSETSRGLQYKENNK
jgi:hypothetical protein